MAASSSPRHERGRAAILGAGLQCGAEVAAEGENSFRILRGRDGSLAAGDDEALCFGGLAEH